MSEKSIGRVCGETINEAATTLISFFGDFYDGLVGNPLESTPEPDPETEVPATTKGRTSK